ncbi:putative oxidoreductase YdhV [Pelotomaculum schinkii]|uniref:Putative oxidoreductase YdhV n=1 Tax=Pelotomaculum schinkii TaxID=78350 RepID=A0A4Y7R8H0_9FIRM|nr:aldehyde ferredoxin oxidoreductase family protein [Pelotomaculum schinkii]TEB05019.1 putative oxidoreductase YdhV [Pelotomaculum schinkii]
MWTAFGYWGKVLEIDLKSQTTKEVPIKNEVYKKFLGGSGVAAYLLYNNYDYTKPALSEENPLIFMTGLLNGTLAPSSARSSVVGKSPLTEIWGEANVGGHWGAEVKKTGYDGFILKGVSDKPVAIYINDNKVQFIDAQDLWGKDVFEASDLMRSKTDEKARIACIGIAGENQIKMASIMMDAPVTRTAGRCGFGALMGYKKVKAVAVKGTKKVELHDKAKLQAFTKEFAQVLKTNAAILHDFGTLGTIQGVESEGDLPIKNWTLGSWEEGAYKTSGQMLAETIQTGHHACHACTIRCGKEAKVPLGPYKGAIGHAPEYETGAAFGSNILNDDLNIIAACNDLCNRYGMDTIEAGSTIAMAIEAYENGLLTKRDTEGIEFKWGMKEELLEVLEKMANNKVGLGRLLAQGVKRASEEIGGIAPEFAIQSKGQAFAMHDPRAYTTMVVDYATCNRGGCHLECLGYFSEGGAYPAKCVDFTKPSEPHGYENKAEYAVRLMNFMTVFNSLGLCKFIMLGQITPEMASQWINAATGWNLTGKDVELAGDRLFNIKRMYNNRLGLSRKDDVLPQRMLLHDRQTGAAAGSLPYYSRIMKDLYDYRKWNAEGIITEEKKQELGLDTL